MLIAVKYRSRTEIIAQILETAKGGASKTKIMYDAYVSYTQLKQYLETLEANELVLLDKTDNHYKTTLKGFVYLTAYGQIRDMTEPRHSMKSSEKLD